MIQKIKINETLMELLQIRLKDEKISDFNKLIQIYENLLMMTEENSLKFSLYILLKYNFYGTNI